MEHFDDSTFPARSTRVRQSTPQEYNQCIDRGMHERVKMLSRGGPEAIDRRLAELDREWDIERTLEANASSLILAGLLLGTTVNRRWLILPVAVSGFLLQHALQGWCPPLPLFRRFGVRTTEEIEEERYALKAIRGDFQEISGAESATQALESVRH